MIIKICGLKTSETAIACIKAGANIIGLVHYPLSPRHLDAAQMREILDAVEPYSALADEFTQVGNRPPGGCVDDSRQESLAIHSAEYRTLPPGGRQPTSGGLATFTRQGSKKHGLQTALVVVEQLPDAEIVSRFDYIQPYGQIRDEIPNKRITVVKDYETFTRLLETPIVNEKLPLHALEMSDGLLPGGNGAAWDWSLARPFCERYPTLIAGGITPENVAEVIRQAKPFGIDVSSGVESAPGVKDIDKAKQLIENVHKAIIFGT